MTDAAALLGVSRTTAWRFVDRGQLHPYARIGNALAFKREDVETLKANREAGLL